MSMIELRPALRCSAASIIGLTRARSIFRRLGLSFMRPTIEAWACSEIVDFDIDAESSEILEYLRGYLHRGRRGKSIPAVRTTIFRAVSSTAAGCRSGQVPAAGGQETLTEIRGTAKPCVSPAAEIAQGLLCNVAVDCRQCVDIFGDLQKIIGCQQAMLAGASSGRASRRRQYRAGGRQTAVGRTERIRLPRAL